MIPVFAGVTRQKLILFHLLSFGRVAQLFELPVSLRSAVACLFSASIRVNLPTAVSQTRLRPVFFLFSLPAPRSELRRKQLGNTPYRYLPHLKPMITAVMTMRAMHDELRDLHAARFAEISALREMLVNAEEAGDSADIAGHMRDSVAEILRLQKIIALIEE
jgi:hypothetical protein